MPARSIGLGGCRLIDWRTTRSPAVWDLQPQVRWAAGSTDCLILESRKRRFRLVLRLPWLRRLLNAW